MSRRLEELTKMSSGAKPGPGKYIEGYTQVVRALGEAADATLDTYQALKKLGYEIGRDVEYATGQWYPETLEPWQKKLFAIYAYVPNMGDGEMIVAQNYNGSVGRCAASMSYALGASSLDVSSTLDRVQPFALSFYRTMIPWLLKSVYGIESAVPSSKQDYTTITNTNTFLNVPKVTTKKGAVYLCRHSELIRDVMYSHTSGTNIHSFVKNLTHAKYCRLVLANALASFEYTAPANSELDPKTSQYAEWQRTWGFSSNTNLTADSWHELLSAVDSKMNKYMWSTHKINFVSDMLPSLWARWFVQEQDEFSATMDAITNDLRGKDVKKKDKADDYSEDDKKHANNDRNNEKEEVVVNDDEEKKAKDKKREGREDQIDVKPTDDETSNPDGTGVEVSTFYSKLKNELLRLESKCSDGDFNNKVLEAFSSLSQSGALINQSLERLAGFAALVSESRFGATHPGDNSTTSLSSAAALHNSSKANNLNRRIYDFITLCLNEKSEYLTGEYLRYIGLVICEAYHALASDSSKNWGSNLYNCIMTELVSQIDVRLVKYTATRPVNTEIRGLYETFGRL